MKHQHMSRHRLEVYMNSYNSKPIVSRSGASLRINIGDEISREDWLTLFSAPDPEIELKVKVEDVRHLFLDAEDIIHTVSIRVVPMS